jgi:hypothetical protein
MALREKRGVDIKMLKFTKGTDPITRDILKFMVDDTVACPQFLPIEEEDVKLTSTAI